MENKIVCPNCKHEIDIEQVLSNELELKYKNQYESQLKKINISFSEKEADLQKRNEEFENKRKELNKIFTEKISAEKAKIEAELREESQAEKLKLEAEIREKAKNDNNVLIEGFKKQLQELQQEKVTFQKAQLENEKLKQDLAMARDTIALELQKEFNQKRLEVLEEAKKQANESFELKLKDQEHKNQKLLEQIEVLQKKANQGSMQAQGEVQELLIEEVLKEMFRLDHIAEVPKGFNGADIIQTVIDRQGNNCGTIIYESKRTKNFSNEWLEKLKADRLKAKAEMAVLVTETMPKEMEHLGIKDGIYVCSLAEFRGLAIVLRDCLLQINQANKSQTNKGDKMEMLYDYLTSPEFKQRIEILKDTFLSLKGSLEKEKLQMQKIWAEREKQLDKVLLNTVGFYGSIQGIAGSAVPDLNLLGDSNEE